MSIVRELMNLHFCLLHSPETMSIIPSLVEAAGAVIIWKAWFEFLLPIKDNLSCYIH